jgi:hypothetical protein
VSRVEAAPRIAVEEVVRLGDDVLFRGLVADKRGEPR